MCASLWSHLSLCTQFLPQATKSPPSPSQMFFGACNFQNGVMNLPLFLVNTYSWIAHQMDIGTMLAFLLPTSNLKSETSFEFPIPNYTGQTTFFVNPQNMIVWLVAAKRYFPGGFRYCIGPLSSNSKSDVCYERKSSMYTIKKFWTKTKKTMFFLLNSRWYARARCYRAHTDQLNFLN